MPTFNSGDSPEMFAMPKAIKGKSIIWEISPITICFGFLMISLKSLRLRESPRFIIIIPITIGNIYVDAKLPFIFQN